MKICKSFFKMLPFNKIPVFCCRNYSLSQVNPALQPECSDPFTKVVRADPNRWEASPFPRSPHRAFQVHRGKESACQWKRCKRPGYNLWVWKTPGGSVVKNPLANSGDMGLDPWVRKIPWSGKQQPTPVFLPEKFHGQRSLVGYKLWGHKESYTTERLSTHTHIHTHPTNTETITKVISTPLR